MLGIGTNKNVSSGPKKNDTRSIKDKYNFQAVARPILLLLFVLYLLLVHAI